MSLRAEQTLGPRHTDSRWYRAAYNYAVSERLLFEQAQSARRKSEARRKPLTLDDLTGEVAALLLVVSRATKASGRPARWLPRLVRAWPGGRRNARAMHPFLENTMEPCTAILLAGVLLESKRRSTGAIRTRTELIRLLDQLVGEANAGRDREKKADQRRAVTGRRRAKRHLISAEALVRYVQGQTPLGYRTRYNLACFYSRSARQDRDEHPRKYRQELKESLDQLKIAFADCPPRERSQLAAWAAEDPALRPLDAGPQEIKKAFRELIREKKSRTRGKLTRR